MFKTMRKVIKLIQFEVTCSQKHWIEDKIRLLSGFNVALQYYNYSRILQLGFQSKLETLLRNLESVKSRTLIFV